jgi:hypothetical protein
MQHRIRLMRMRTIVWLAALLAAPALLPGTAQAQAAAVPEGAQAPSPRLLAEASWHGRPIQRPLARRTDAADRAPSLAPGTGYSRPGGSRRVRDLQRRLIRLGYRPGPSDGLFGPRTQAAVLAFQRKHGLEQTGSAGSATLGVLRRRTAPGAGPAAAETPLRTQSAPRPQEPPRPAPPAQAVQDEGALTTFLLLALAIPLVLVTGLLVRSRRGPAADGPPAPPRALPAPAEAPVPVRPPEPEPEPVPTPAPSADIPRVRRTPPPRMPHPRQEDRRAALRERILRMRVDGMTLQEIADVLTEEGEVTLGGARRWQPWSVRAATRATGPQGRPAAHGRDRR